MKKILASLLSVCVGVVAVVVSYADISVDNSPGAFAIETGRAKTAEAALTAVGTNLQDQITIESNRARTAETNLEDKIRLGTNELTLKDVIANGNNGGGLGATNMGVLVFGQSDNPGIVYIGVGGVISNGNGSTWLDLNSSAADAVELSGLTGVSITSKTGAVYIWGSALIVNGTNIVARTNKTVLSITVGMPTNNVRPYFSMPYPWETAGTLKSMTSVGDAVTGAVYLVKHLRSDPAGTWAFVASNNLSITPTTTPLSTAVTNNEVFGVWFQQLSDLTALTNTASVYLEVTSP